MRDPPFFEQGGDSFDQSGHHFIFSRNHTCEIIGDRSLEEQAEALGFFEFVAKFNDGEECLARDTAPIEADTP